MILDEIFAAITHVATQLTGRWFPMPSVTDSIAVGYQLRAVDQFQYGGYSAIDDRSWLELLEVDASSYRPALAWVDVVLRTNRVSLSTLAGAAARHFREISVNGGECVSILSSRYPPLLRWISKPPLLLSAMGDVDLLTKKSVAAIGSRKASYEALRMSVETGMALCHTDWAVTSGGAIGCDIAVHEGMLCSGMHHVAAVIVFAGGLQDRFPRCNERTFGQILDRGGLFLSERLWFQSVLPRDFPARNRIVSGISQAVAVMGAAPRSGSLITANEALEQGRDVFVFEGLGNEVDARMEGSQQLINDGAFPFSCPEQLLEYLSYGYDLSPQVPLGHTRAPCQLATSIGTFKTEPNIH